MNYFNDITELSPNEINFLLELSERLELNPEPNALKGKVLGLLFLNPSLRTMTSFQSAMIRLGGGSFVVSPDMSIHGLETKDDVIMDGKSAEHIKEAIPVISSYSDAIGIRSFANMNNMNDDIEDKEYKKLTKLVDKPYINMESAIRHPCQNLADWKTLNDFDVSKQNGKFVLSWAYHPRALPLAVPASTLNMAVLRGMHVTILRPDEFQLPEAIMKKARLIASDTGAKIEETSDMNEAMFDANILYAKSWISPSHYENLEEETEIRSKYKNWCISDEWFESAEKSCRFMHCLPIRRGVVADHSVLDSARSIVIPEAKNRLLVQMAILHTLLK